MTMKQKKEQNGKEKHKNEMRLLFPSWVNHDGGAIFSIDCNPTADKFVTCGQGDSGGNGIIKVWNLEPIFSESKAKDESIPKALCTIRLQSGANCVRWSPDGKRLAVGCDDSAITLYEYMGRVQSAGSVMGKMSMNVERYKELSTLRGHNMEVLCVEWSPNRKYLASSSMDSTICIWSAKRLGEAPIVLRGHDDAVKGISWDPIGKYLASLSADRTLRVWNTDDWTQDKSKLTTKPFQDSGQTTMFSRLDWSPDGQFLLAPTAMNHDGPTTQIFERQKWDYSKDLVGHRKASTCVRSLPRLLSYKDSKGKMLSVSCFAVGSRDKGLSVWLIPGLLRPVVAIHNIFKHSIMDLSWKDTNLAVCSQDGTVAFLSFQDRHVGTMLSKPAIADICYKIFRQRPPQFCEEDEDVTSALDETTDERMTSSFVETAEDYIALKKKAEAANGVSATVPAATTVANKKTDEEKSKTQKLLEERNKQTEQVKDGKRRIQPVFLGSTKDDTPHLITAKKSPVVENLKPKTIKGEKPKNEVLKVGPKKDGVESTAESSSDSNDEDEEDEDEEEEEDVETKGAKQKRLPDAPPVLAADFKAPQLRKIESRYVRVTPTESVLDAPEQKPSFVEVVVDKKIWRIEVNNRFRCTSIDATRVALVAIVNGENEELEKKKMLWAELVEAPVLLVAANKNWCVLGCGDRCLRVLAMSTGTQMLVLQLDSLTVQLGVNDQCAYALTESAKISTWDLRKGCTVVDKEAVLECVNEDSNLTSISMSEKGVPLISFSTGNIFVFSTSFKRWKKIFTQSNLLKLCDTTDLGQISDGLLGRLLRQLRRPAVNPSVPAGVCKLEKEKLLKNLLDGAETLQSARDYKGILQAYAGCLAQNESVARLRDLMSYLGGSTPICGLKRSALLSDVTRLIETRFPHMTSHVCVGSVDLAKKSHKNDLF